MTHLMTIFSFLMNLDGDVCEDSRQYSCYNPSILVCVYRILMCNVSLMETHMIYKGFLFCFSLYNKFICNYGIMSNGMHVLMTTAQD
jgi:hypothetical protein